MVDRETLQVAWKGCSLRVLDTVGSSDLRPFWSSFGKGEWERDTLDLIERMVGPGTTFYDVGAWVGPTTLWGASCGADVVSFEPDPVALEALRTNVALNPDLAPRITVIPAAVGAEAGHIDLYSNALGNSETTSFASIHRNNVALSLTEKASAPVVDIAAFIAARGPQAGSSFIKMDIEGGEFAALPALEPILTRYDIPIAVTLHPINVSSPNPDAVPFLRYAALLSTMKPFLDLHWYLFEQGAFRPIGKTTAMNAMGNSLNRHFTFVLSRKPLV